MNSVAIIVAYGEGQQIFSWRTVDVAVCALEQLVWHKVQQPLGKTHHLNVSQTRLSLDTAEGLV